MNVGAPIVFHTVYMITLLIFIQSLIAWLDFCYTVDARHRLHILLSHQLSSWASDLLVLVFPAPRLGAILEQIHAPHVNLAVAGDIRAVGEFAVGTPGRVGHGLA